MRKSEPEAWQLAEDEAERERLRRLKAVPLIERLRHLEAQSRFLQTIRARHERREGGSGKQ